MITHFAELRLNTVSIQGVTQVYSDCLGLPILNETDDSIVFQLTPHTNITFHETYEPISPAHFAISVPYSTFYESADFIKKSGLIIVKWDDGHDIDDNNPRLNLYFRDGDGNLLEIVAHTYVEENVLPPIGPLRALYLREVGFPVDSVPIFRNWLKSNLSMKTNMDGDADIFNFVIGGTAHAVVNWKGRSWEPIAMKALAPKMHVTYGTPNISFMEQVQNNLCKREDFVLNQSNEISFLEEGYSFTLRYTPDFRVDIPARLKLPLA